MLVALSGGVDSSVAAYLLKKEGYAVEGVTIYFNSRSEKCIKDAKKIASKLKIPCRVLNLSKEFEDNVIDGFITEYLNGRTPNPCVNCNRALKFGILFDKMREWGFNFLATGHYARITVKGKKISLKKGKDKTKDQSYFLYSVRKDVLKKVRFPLGELTKGEVRKIARGAKLPVCGRGESQDICFLPDRDYHSFLSERTDTVQRGPIITLEGECIGEHKGAAFYTIGQRGGLGVGYKHPLYVLSIDPRENRLVVGKREDLVSLRLLAGNINILVDRFPERARAKIRYNQKEAACRVFERNKGTKLEIIFDRPEEAVTPGQSVVLYDKDTVLGGGIIEKSFGGA